MTDSSPQDTPPASTPRSGSRAAGLLRSTGIVSLMTLLSRVLGLVRDVTVANLFGAGSGSDAFFVAFKIPNFFRRLFAEGAFAQAFVPILTEYRTRRDHAAVRLLVAQTAGSLTGVLSLLTVLVVAIAPWVVMVFAPGFYQMPEKLALAGEMLRFTFPYLLLISLTAFAGSVLNSYGRFAVPAFTPVLLNLVLIGFAVGVSPYLASPIMALAYAVLVAGMVQLAFQLPFLKRMDLLPRPVWGWRSEGVTRIRRLMLPALFGVSVGQINLLLDTVLASFLQTGSVSWLYFSDRLMELPLGVFGIAIATVILPSLSRHYAKQLPADVQQAGTEQGTPTSDGQAAQDGFARTLDWALRLVLLIGVPAALALVVLAEPLLITLFQYGEFSAQDVTMAAMSLRAYALGLLAFMLVKVLAPGFYARQDTRTPVKIGVIAMVANMVMNLLLIWPLAHAGLALATSLSACLNAALLLRGLLKLGVYQWQPGWGTLLLRMAVACALMVAVIVVTAPTTDTWLAGGWLIRSGSLALVVMAGLSVYVAALVVSGLRPRHLRLGD